MVLFITLGVLMLALVLTLNVSWIILNWRRLAPLLLGVPVFCLLMAGVVLNTIFLVREVRRNERHDSFLQAVTHELKTPIASIRLYLETLERRNLSEQQRREFYQIMLEDSDRLLATVEQVLKAAEIGQRSSKQVRAPVDMVALVEECVTTTRLRHHLDPAAIRLQVASEDGPLRVRGNANELRVILLNILDNAVKYSRQSPQITVDIGAEGGAWVRLSVADQGIGIPAAHLKRVFRRFYRVPSRSSLRVKGTGLGLFLVRSLARQHGGDALAESPGEGRGTTLRVLLPRILGAALEPQQLAEAEAAPAADAAPAEGAAAHPAAGVV